MKLVEDFIVYEGKNSKQIYIDIGPLKEFKITENIFIFTFVFFFILFASFSFFEQKTPNSFFFYLFAFLGSATLSFVVNKYKDIAHNINVMLHEERKSRFLDYFIYNEKNFNLLMNDIAFLLSAEEKNQIVQEVIAKEFSQKSFELIYDACIEKKKSSFEFLENGSSQEIVFFEKNSKKV